MLLAIALCMSSCNVGKQLEKISVDGIENVTVSGISASRIGLNLYISVSNFSNKNLQLKSGTVDVFSEGKKLYTIRIKEPVKVAKHTQGVVCVPVIAEFSSPFGVLGLVSHLDKYDGFVMNVEFVFKAGPIQKTYRQDDMPVKAVMGDVDTGFFRSLIDQLGN